MKFRLWASESWLWVNEPSCGSTFEGTAWSRSVKRRRCFRFAGSRALPDYAAFVPRVSHGPVVLLLQPPKCMEEDEVRLQVMRAVVFNLYGAQKHSPPNRRKCSHRPDIRDSKLRHQLGLRRRIFPAAQRRGHQRGRPGWAERQPDRDRGTG